MVISQFAVVLLSILLVFAALIIPTLLFLRQHAMKADMVIINDRLQSIQREYVAFCETAQTINRKVSDVDAELHAAKTRDASTQETIRNLGNKLNSRERAARKQEKLEPVEQEVNSDEPDFEQMSIKFPGQVIPMHNSNKGDDTPAPRQRRFGELP